MNHVQERMQTLITQDEDILGGIPVFLGTRVPIQTLLDYLEGGHPLDEFLNHFPTVQRRQAQDVLSLLGSLLQEEIVLKAA